ncbi:hypothetical protein M2475_000440 [Breznakia sp. PF5-3]|uniref:hypothetical protein n=1 Tax=unclassified Breznakia TaxID=2623764 RepID=UPI00240635FE|nr:MULTISPECIES: hypothetical protein [unclassified Breznakia]MDF9824046.1 hypothetical protein [Breznakia sp. PM6-1]MDF9834888.1 hypothetical protein [Breznakia sp. PF5-3]MDF9837090.1 hypothetical protein [Breznakia sp. PFB2-8]MDF9859015.1 hypothetical protein [Breznakia sp. PH5-24]
MKKERGKVKKKTKQIVVAAIALIVVVAGIFLYQQLGQDKGDKEIHIMIKADGKTLYKESVDTDAGTLADLLKELEQEGEIKLDYEDQSYGMYIKGMGKNKLYKENPKANKYWVYSSENNKSCIEAGYCDAANALKITDQDYFVFELSEITY